MIGQLAPPGELKNLPSRISFMLKRSQPTKLTKGKNCHIQPNSLEANIECFRLSTVSDDESN